MDNSTLLTTALRIAKEGRQRVIIEERYCVKNVTIVGIESLYDTFYPIQYHIARYEELWYDGSRAGTKYYQVSLRSSPTHGVAQDYYGATYDIINTIPIWEIHFPNATVETATLKFRISEIKEEFQDIPDPVHGTYHVPEVGERTKPCRSTPH